LLESKQNPHYTKAREDCWQLSAKNKSLSQQEGVITE